MLTSNKWDKTAKDVCKQTVKNTPCHDLATDSMLTGREDAEAPNCKMPCPHVPSEKEDYCRQGVCKNLLSFSLYRYVSLLTVACECVPNVYTYVVLWLKLPFR